MNQSGLKSIPKAIVFKNVTLIVIIILLTVLPLVIRKKAEFAGTDDLAEQAITVIKPNYRPWFKPLWEPPSAEIESLLFSLQAALGAGFIGYYIGFARGRKKALEN